MAVLVIRPDVYGGVVLTRLEEVEGDGSTPGCVVAYLPIAKPPAQETYRTSYDISMMQNIIEHTLTHHLFVWQLY